MDFDKYGNSLNEITNQENKAELESFYTLHSSVLQFFKAIDKTIQEILKKSNIGETVLKQLESALPTLTKLKKEISKLDSETFAVGYKTKINQSVTNIKNGMTLSEVNDTAQEFFDLLKENKNATISKQKEIAQKEKETAERKKREQAERERKTKEEKERIEYERREQERRKLQKEQEERERNKTFEVCFNYYGLKVGVGSRCAVRIFMDNTFFGEIIPGIRWPIQYRRGVCHIKLEQLENKKQKCIEFDVNVQSNMVISLEVIPECNFIGWICGYRIDYSIQ